VKPQSSIPEEVTRRFFQNVDMRAWTDAEKELDTIRQKAENTAWCKGYVKALEGLLLTYKSNDDKYIYLPKALSNPTEESVNQLRGEFAEFASNEIHGEYDRGYFKALEDYLTLLSTEKHAPSPTPVTPPEPTEKMGQSKTDESLTPYLAESS
jgi:hypothetical protein